VTSLAPNNGAETGGTLVLVNGSNFGGAGGPVSVLFGGAPGTSAQVLSASQVRVRTPARDLHGAAFVSVDVQVRASGHVADVTKGFDYLSSLEAEPANGGGVNDSFVNPELIPMDATFSGFIGQLGDI